MTSLGRLRAVEGNDWLDSGDASDDFYGGTGTDTCRQGTGTGARVSGER